jgi:succinyl-CoA synthetase beta subunit
LKVHEYQAKEVLRRYGVPLLQGGAATTPEEARAVAQRIGGNLWVVKSQIHAGGRGKGRFKEEVSRDELLKASNGEDASGKGGVRLAKSMDEVESAAHAMLGNTLVTKQTGIEGKVVRTVLVESGCRIARELYLAIMLDRSNNRILFMASTEGGVNIEEVAEHNPAAIQKIWADPLVGLGGWQARQLAFSLGITGKAFNPAVKAFLALYKAYMEADASMVEINPLVVTEDGDVICLDAKVTYDDNALFRHADIAMQRDEHEEDPAETQAARSNLSYVALDGNIGCMVNGAGLAMSTMDIIQYKGGKPANFLDVGGGATAEKVTTAFKIILKDPSVEAILVNIFGGIMKCDVIAQGVLDAVKEVGLEVPLVVRLAGTNEALGKQILATSGLAITAVTTLDEAGSAIVAAVRN